MALFNRKRKSRGGRVGSWKRSKSSSRVISRKRVVRRRSSKFARRVMAVVNRRAENKEVFRAIANNVDLPHNQVTNLDTNALFTDLGTAGEQMTTGSAAGGCRIGKDIYLKGIKCAVNLEGMQMRPHTDYWIYLLRNKAADAAILGGNQMFEGTSSTLPLDYIDTDKVDIKFCKRVTLRMPNHGTSKDMIDPNGWANLTEPGPDDTLGTAYAGQDKSTVTNPQKIFKFYVPFNRKITYRDNNNTDTTNRVIPIADHRYQWVVVAYDNFSTKAATTVDCGHIHMTTKLIFTDV